MITVDRPTPFPQLSQHGKPKNHENHLRKKQKPSKTRKKKSTLSSPSNSSIAHLPPGFFQGTSPGPSRARWPFSPLCPPPNWDLGWLPQAPRLGSGSCLTPEILAPAFLGIASGYLT